MTSARSDALVFFGATGDLAYKKIFPALQAMVKRGNLDIPVIGVANAGWKVDQLRARAKESLETRCGLGPQAFEKLSGLLRYVDGEGGWHKLDCRDLRGDAPRNQFLALEGCAYFHPRREMPASQCR